MIPLHRVRTASVSCLCIRLRPALAHLSTFSHPPPGHRLASVTATHGLGELVHGDGVVAVERVHRAIKDLLARLAGAQAKEQ